MTKLSISTDPFKALPSLTVSSARYFERLGALFSRCIYLFLLRMFCFPEVNKFDDGHVRSHNLTLNRVLNMIG